MKIKLHQISIRDIFNGYSNDNEDGVVGYGGKLNIRPKYQREFVYKDNQRDAVINTVKKSFPLNVMYWIDNGNDTFEVLDGQQRTISICEYVAGRFSIDEKYFHNLTNVEQEQILNYKIMIYFCTGNDKEKLDWFKTINIAGEKLTEQELRNAVYTGEWLTDAKRHFSKTGCVAYNISKDYLKGSAIRQDYLEKAISWIANSKGIKIEEYMALMQHKPDANELWLYFQSVINWVKTVFRNYRNEMKGLEWGILYNKYKDKSLDSTKLEERIKTLMMDEDVTKKSGIYEYLLSGNEKYLNIRAFSMSMKREAYERQNGKCNNKNCPEKERVFDIKEMEGDHVIPWHDGGKTIAENCQMLCIPCNRYKSGK